MDFKYIKSEIYNLGFSTKEDVDISIVVQAINRAVDTIANTVRPILSMHHIPKEEGDAKIKFYNIKEIAKEKGETFVAIHEVFEITDEGIAPAANFMVVNRYVLQARTDREYLVYYKKMHTPVTQDTADTFEFELDADLHILIPLLAAFYVWQDDEERKADKLYNDYEMKRNDIVARENKVVAYVRGG